MNGSDLMSTTNNEYGKMADKASPPSPKLKNCIKAFLFGGAICAFGEFLNWGFEKMNFSEDAVKALTPSVLIVIAAILTGIGVFDKIAKHAGAGTIVPTNVLKLPLVFFLICVILVLTVITIKGAVNMQDIFNIPEDLFDTIESVFNEIISQKNKSVNHVIEHLTSLSDEVVDTLIKNPLLFNMLGSTTPTSNTHMVVSYTPASSINASNVADTQLINDVKNAFYRHCYENGKLSFEDYSTLTKKESSYGKTN